MALIEKISLVNNLETARQLEKYNRINIESGKYWKEHDRFKIINRIDSVLIKNLQIMRTELLKTISSADVVHRLLGRTILIKYLEDRKDRNGNTAFPASFFSEYYPGATSFVDVLSDKHSTYRLFEFFQDKFHGDMFLLLGDEKEEIQESDLLRLKDFLSGTIDLDGNQLTLWPLYSFELIPIQLISTIYEMFFQLRTGIATKENRHGTYYTPYHLVEMLLDEVFPWDGEYREDFKILDPSCGSGVFLVEAYRRIISRWMISQETNTITPEQLKYLLSNHIFGVDLNEESIRIASFSLCLVLCDYLEPLSIWNELEFPVMRNKSLFEEDFFDDESNFNRYKYDLIIGNPPWESKTTEKAKAYLKATGYVIGDNQISQAFTWKSADLCQARGNICLLMPSKGFLFNRSSTNLAYRRSFFENNDALTIVNFTGYKSHLFQNAKSPATAIFYRPKGLEYTNQTILYCTPKPVFSIEDRRQFIIEPIDICRLPIDIIDNEYIWKICMFGGPRDLELINKLIANYETLETFKNRHRLTMAEGYKVGKADKEYENFYDKPMVDVKKDMYPFKIYEDQLGRNTRTKFERIAKKNLEVFEAPHLLIRQSSKEGRFVSAFLDFDAIFTHSVLGIHGNELLLKYLCLLLSSKLFSYYSLMTSGRWIIERSELEAREFKNFPMPEFPQHMGDKIQNIFNILTENPNEKGLIDNFVFELYGLNEYERCLVNDAMEYILGYNTSSTRTLTTAPCNEEAISLYSNVLINVLKNTFGSEQEFSIESFCGGFPLAVSKVTLNTKNTESTIYTSHNDDLKELLQTLDTLLLEKHSQGLYVRRNVTIYEQHSIYIVKPNQKRYWTYSSACRDADDIYAQIMRTWRSIR